jgi:hypothetical protein
MTATEFEIIDQLYFVTSYADLIIQSELANETIEKSLWSLIQKGWVKCLSDPETEVFPSYEEFGSEFSNYHYLATKKGLFEHNAI